MNIIQPLDQISKIVASALNWTAKKNFESSIIETMILKLKIYGRVSLDFYVAFTKLARICR